MIVVAVKIRTLRIFSVSPPGPLEEKVATTGAGLECLISFAGSIVAVGFLFKIKHQISIINKFSKG